MRSPGKQIEASRVTIEDDVSIGASSIIRGEEVVLRKGVRIGDNVEITCDSLDMGRGCTVGSNSGILSPRVVLEEGCSIAPSLRAELNQYLHLGRFCILRQSIHMVGQGVKLGDFVFLDSGITIGGGGARGPRSFLTIGRRTSIFANSLVNLSEEVRIGHSVGISFNVALLTHYAWQPVLKGYTARFAPISIEDHATIYFNVIVLPGVAIGEWSTVGAGSIVVRDVPAHCLAVGNPAKVVRGPEGYPRPLDGQQQDLLMRTILADYLTSLEPKGVQVVEDFLTRQNGGATEYQVCEGYAIVEYEGRRESIHYLPALGFSETARDKALSAPGSMLYGQADITLSLGPVPAEFCGRCHFDLDQDTLTGEPTRIAEDLRDYLRRRGIRIFTDRPFQSLPLMNLQRLRRRRQVVEGDSPTPPNLGRKESGPASRRNPRNACRDGHHKQPVRKEQ